MARIEGRGRASRDGAACWAVAEGSGERGGSGCRTEEPAAGAEAPGIEPVCARWGGHFLHASSALRRSLGDAPTRVSSGGGR